LCVSLFGWVGGFFPHAPRQRAEGFLVVRGRAVPTLDL
jgi:hypothetical protein